MRKFWHGRNLIGFSCLLAFTAAATVAQAEGAAPAVSSIAFASSPARGDTYELGETIEVEVEFDRAVTATGRPLVELTIGTQTQHATFSRWDTQSVYFHYTVHEADRDEDGISIPASALLLNGGTITAADGTTDADLTHAAAAPEGASKVNGSLVSPPAVKRISFVSSPATDDTYELGETIAVIVQFDRVVIATGRAQVALTIGEETRHATSLGWGSRPSLYFNYAVQEGDRDEDGISIPANALTLDGGTIKSADGTADAGLTHAAVAPDRVNKVDGSSDVTPPQVRDIYFDSSPARGDTYELGETVEVVVEFDGAIKATGEPQVALTIGTETRHATMAGWGSDALYFYYTVQAGDRDTDGISIPANALALNGGTITAADGTTEAVLAHEAVAPEGASKVNGSDVTPPGVRFVYFRSSPARGDTYEFGETVEVEVGFDRAVTVTGNPLVALTIGTQTRHAAFRGWGSDALYFDYTVQEGDRDTDGISIPANALALNGGTITVANGRTDADLTHGTVAADGGRKMNGSLVTPPTVRDIYFISSPARGDTYELGETIEVLVEFDRAVTVTGSPQVALTIGSETRHAAYSTSWWDDRYTDFSYVVQEGDRDEDGVSIAANSLLLNGGTIKSADDTTDADLTHAEVAPERDRKVDGSSDVTPPRVRAIYFDSSPARGDTYELGETVEVEVEFDGAIKATGSPS